MELAACHLCGAYNFDVAPKILEFIHPLSKVSWYSYLAMDVAIQTLKYYVSRINWFVPCSLEIPGLILVRYIDFLYRNVSWFYLVSLCKCRVNTIEKPNPVHPIVFSVSLSMMNISYQCWVAAAADKVSLHYLRCFLRLIATYSNSLLYEHYMKRGFVG